MLHHLALYRLKNVFFAGTPESSRIHSNQHIRGRKFALIDDTFDQCVAAAFDKVDLDAGLSRKFLVKRHICVVVAGGINVDDFLCHECCWPNARQSQRK